MGFGHELLSIVRSKAPQILSTHPSHANRIQDLKKYAKRVEPLFKTAIRR